MSALADPEVRKAVGVGIVLLILVIVTTIAVSR